MIRELRITIVTVGMLFGASIYAQDPYLRPSLTDRESMVDGAGVIPQLNLAMTHANVVDVLSGAILRDVTVAVRDGKIVSVGNDDPPAGAEEVDMEGRYITPGFFEGHFHGSTVGSAQRALSFFFVIIVPLVSHDELKVSLIQTTRLVRLLLTANIPGYEIAAIRYLGCSWVLVSC